MGNIIKVAIVEDVQDIRESIQMLIDRTPGYSCEGAYVSAEVAIENILVNTPDVVLMDINLPGISGVEAVKQLKDIFPDMKFLMISVFDDDENIFMALRAGADGYILKSVRSQKIIEAIKEVMEGGAPMSAAIAKRVIQSFIQVPVKVTPKHAALSKREMEVVELLSQGLFYKEVAARLDLSIDTIRNHCRNIYEKLHVNTKLEAINIVFKRK